MTPLGTFIIVTRNKGKNHKTDFPAEYNYDIYIILISIIVLYFIEKILDLLEHRVYYRC